MEERTERESDSRRREEKWQTCWCCRDQQKTCRMAQASAEKLEQTGPAEKAKSGLSATERAVGKYAGAALTKKEKEQSCQSRVLDHEEGESQGGREPHLGEKGGSEREHGEERVDSTVNEGRFRGGKGGQARRASLGEIEGIMSGRVDARALQDDLQSLGLTPSLAKPEIGKKVGRRRARS